MSDIEGLLWDFSLKVWDHASIREMLLDLQEHQNLDINLCLFLLWCWKEKSHPPPNKDAMQKVQSQWLAKTIIPIRQLRKAKSHDEELKKALLHAEVLAEKRYQKALCTLICETSRDGSLEVPPKDSDRAATLKAMLESYTELKWDSTMIKGLLEATE